MVSSTIELSGALPEADAAEAWAEQRAREARLSRRASFKYGRLVRNAYDEARQVLVTSGREAPVIRISVTSGDLTPRIELLPPAER